MLASIMGPDLLVVLLVVLVIFGGTQIPKLARSLGSAQREFQRGLDHGDQEAPASDATVVAGNPPAESHPQGGPAASPVETPRS